MKVIGMIGLAVSPTLFFLAMKWAMGWPDESYASAIIGTYLCAPAQLVAGLLMVIGIMSLRGGKPTK